MLIESNYISYNFVSVSKSVENEVIGVLECLDVLYDDAVDIINSVIALFIEWSEMFSNVSNFKDCTSEAIYGSILEASVSVLE